MDENAIIFSLSANMKAKRSSKRSVVRIFLESDLLRELRWNCNDLTNMFQSY